MTCLEVALPEGPPRVAAQLALLEDDAELAVDDVAPLVQKVVRGRIPVAPGQDVGVADAVNLLVAGIAVDLLEVGGEEPGNT